MGNPNDPWQPDSPTPAAQSGPPIVLGYRPAPRAGGGPRIADVCVATICILFAGAIFLLAGMIFLGVCAMVVREFSAAAIPLFVGFALLLAAGFHMARTAVSRLRGFERSGDRDAADLLKDDVTAIFTLILGLAELMLLILLSPQLTPANLSMGGLLAVLPIILVTLLFAGLCLNNTRRHIFSRKKIKASRQVDR